MIYLSSDSYFIENVNYLSISHKESEWLNGILDDIRDSIYSTEESRFCNESIINTYNIGDYIYNPGRYLFKKYYNNVVSRGHFTNKANEVDVIIMLMREFINKEDGI